MNEESLLDISHERPRQYDSKKVLKNNRIDYLK
jgi:hypothetical protein